MTTLTATTHQGPPAVFDRPLTADELAEVVARVGAADYEHGLVAALAVADIAAADRCAKVRGADELMAIPAIPLHQWVAIQQAIDRETTRRHPGGDAAVLADWVLCGPRISAC